MYGNCGKILKIDLGAKEVKVEHYEEAFARKFLGGNGFAAKLIHDTVPSNAEPLRAENALVFTVGPLTDTPVWGTSRGHMASISPLTGLFADSNYGGNFGSAQKRTGFDAIQITGKSPKPVYLLVTEEGVGIRDGASLWGKTTEETIGVLQAQEGRDAVCAAIGPAGENGVLFASIVCGGTRFGTAGRAGMGAVMGSKNLKALVLKGDKKTGIADKAALRAFLREKLPLLKRNTGPYTALGTPFLVNLINSIGLLGTHNNSRETFEYFEDISGELIKEKYWRRNTACLGCPVACGKLVEGAGAEHVDKRVKMPEYETLYALGSMLDNRDIISLMNGNYLCDLMGIDTISMGVTLAFVAECMERGVVSEKELGGRVRFGDGEGIVELIKKTARKEGMGEHLAVGSWGLSKQFGRDSHKYLYAVKGLEIAGHSARGLRGMSLAYPTSTRGGSHHDARPHYPSHDPDPGFAPQPEYVVKNQHYTAVGDSLVMCRFTAERGVGTPLNEDMVKLVNYVTGWDFSLQKLERIGERIYNLERLINVGRGVSRKDDTLPYRVMNEPIPDGPSKGRHCSQEDLDKMLDAFYDLRGWSQDGIPTDQKLTELGLK
jgi:aldehyde:ferredoxin oxidoreductase